ncbi:hypothetical protein B296_00021266, partial [Ensete ventricosum]
MHLPRFPNSSIRAKVFVRKIGLKLRVMRLNRVELFYALVASIGSESWRYLWGRGGHMHAFCMQRWLAKARPVAGVVGHVLATCKGWSVVSKAPLQGGNQLRPGPLQGAIARQWLACKVQP